MDPEKNLVFLKENNEDQSLHITNIERVGDKVKVRFLSGKSYYYNNANVQWFDNGQKIIFDGYIYHHGKLLENYIKIIGFESRFYKFKFKEQGHYCYKTYLKSELIFEEKLNHLEPIKRFLDYIKEIVSVLPSDQNFLPDQLSKIDVKKDCCLASYALQRKPTQIEDECICIFPFGSNVSQKEAVKRVFHSNMSLIQGPPGTGKTQTILNIIANIILRGKTVAVVSNNNTATENVREKLAKGKVDFISAFLGNTDNLNAFFSEEHNIPEEVEQWSCNSDELEITKRAFCECEKKIKRGQERLIELAQIDSLLEELAIEQAVNSAEAEYAHKAIPNVIKKAAFTSKQLLSLKASLEVLPKNKLIEFFLHVRMLFKYGVFRLPKEQMNEIQDYLDALYYKTKIRELRLRKQELEYEAKTENFNDLKSKEQALSIKIFRNAIANRMKQCTGTTFDRKKFRTQFEAFVKRFPVQLNTTHALLSSTKNNYFYDYVIIDESSQVSIVTAAIALSKAKNIVLVGDHMQLSHIVKSQDKPRLKEIFVKYGLDPAYEYTQNSILDSFNKLYGETISQTLLTEHYRCDPQIIEFCNKRFYKNQLVISSKRGDGKAVTILHTESHSENNRTNERQVCAIEEYLPNLNDSDLGIIAPFNNQVNLLKEHFKERNYKIETIHKFQGQENKVIILSTVSDKIRLSEDPENIDFVNNPNLLNVAISRAEEQLVVAISKELMLQKGAILSDFSRYVKYFCDRGEIVKSSVYSVFDLMYQDYSPILEPLRKRVKDNSLYPSENIIEAVIEEICEEQKYGVFKYVQNYPLRKILNVQYIKDEADIRFVKNENTHCDFVIYHDLDKAIQLIIEVDGKQHNDPVQKARDQRKDWLLKAANIKVIRLLTTGVVHKETIENALQQSLMS